jgi:hypothetical protein
MNREQTKEVIKVMQHFAEGGEIEHRDRGDRYSRKWQPLTDPLWDWADTEYRIKPKPLEGWATVVNGCITTSLYQSKAFAEGLLTGYSDRRVVKFREVTE